MHTNNLQVEFKTERDRVTVILAADERARNSDKWLVYKVWEQVARENGFKGIFVPFELFAKLPTTETITRSRRYIQHNLGLYPPTTQEIADRRKLRCEDHKLLFGRRAKK